MEGLALIDWVVLALLAIAAVRGLFLGLVREVFSLTALAAAIVAVRVLGGPAGQWLSREAALGELPARILAGLALAVGSIVAVALLGRLVRRGVQAAGLGIWDRLSGGLLGAAEGALAAVLLVYAASLVLGRDHSLLAESHSLAALEQLEELTRDSANGGPAVAAPPRRR